MKCADFLTLVIGAMLAMATIRGTHSQNVIEKLVTPGPLIEGHAKLEKECSQCHVPFSRQAQSNLCLACHKEIAADRLARRGFHGRQTDAVRQECRSCHTDHKGRSADIIQFDRETFNHSFTNFTLNGAHVSVACNKCHDSTAKFRNTPSSCVGCHKAVDPHKGRLGEACEGCHNDNGWARVKAFDHSKTQFPLEGAHKSVECSFCHAGERYAGIGTTCIACHKIQDVHASRYGTKCETCHGQNDWKKVRFDHNKTKYPLRGAHVKVNCDSCHVGFLTDKLATSCVSCHQKDDPHKGQLGIQCEKCHQDSGWRKRAGFDHDLTRFPLIGRHAIVPCEECHQSATFKGTPIVCASCHKDDHHEGRFGTNCGLCHNPNGWARWRFDHDSQTKYPLAGAHRGLDCSACHTAKHLTKITLPTDCYSCHRGDDVHEGSFGHACERCHTTQSFKTRARVQ